MRQRYRCRALADAVLSGPSAVDQVAEGKHGGDPAGLGVNIVDLQSSEHPASPNKFCTTMTVWLPEQLEGDRCELELKQELTRLRGQDEVRIVHVRPMRTAR